MKIANQKTFQQFDRLKQQLYAHKRQKSTKPKTTKPPINFKLRTFIPLVLMGGGLWLAYKNSPQVSTYLVDNNHITYQQKLALDAMELYLKCKWKQMFGVYQSFDDKNLANRCYLTKLESDWIYLNQKSAEKKLSIETKSKLSFWVLALTNQQKIKYINQYGDLYQKHVSSKVMVGDFIRIWTNSSYRLLKRQKIFQFYKNEVHAIGKQCEKINYLTKLRYKGEQYQEVLKECHRQSELISLKIRKLIQERLSKQNKLKIINS